MKKSSLWIIVLILLLVACGPAAQPTTAPGESPAATPGAVETPEPSPAVEPTSEIPPSEGATSLPTSDDLIAQALEAGEIDYETSLLYRTYAIFGDQRLPEEFLSVVINPDAASFLFAEIFENQDQLSAETMESLAPFMARPSDPVSIFYQAASSARPGLAAAPQNPSPQTAPDCESVGIWRCRTAAGGKARVWVSDPDPATVDVLLDKYAADVSDIWPEMENIFGFPFQDTPGNPSPETNPDNAIDIYFFDFIGPDPRVLDMCNNPVPPQFNIPPAQWPTVCVHTRRIAQESALDGFATPTEPSFLRPGQDPQSSGYAVISASLDADELVGTIAHMLMHVTQYAFDFTEVRWLKESTAQWGELRIMQELGRSLDFPHKPLETFFNNLERLPLNRSNGWHEYGGYLYSFFASMEQGDRIVNFFWQEARDGLFGAGAIDNIFPFRDHFRDFALRNWNRDPVTPLYSSKDNQFPDLRAGYVNYPLVADVPQTLDIDLLPLTARYSKFTVGGEPSPLKITIDLSDMIQEGAGVDAIVTIAGKQPEVRHWTNVPSVIFCMDNPAQELEELVLIVSNGRVALTEPEVSALRLQGQIVIEPESLPCSGWTGTITYATTYNLSSSGGTLTSSEAAHITIDSPNDNLVGRGSYTYSEDVFYTTPDCPPDFYSAYATGSGPVEMFLIFYEGNYELSINSLGWEAAGQEHSWGTMCIDGTPFDITNPITRGFTGFYVEYPIPDDPDHLVGTWSETCCEDPNDQYTTIISWDLTRSP